MPRVHLLSQSLRSSPEPPTLFGLQNPDMTQCHPAHALASCCHAVPCCMLSDCPLVLCFPGSQPWFGG